MFWQWSESRRWQKGLTYGVLKVAVFVDPSGEGGVGSMREMMVMAVVTVGVSVGRRKREAWAHWVMASRTMFGVVGGERRRE